MSNIFPYRWLPRTFFPNIGYFFYWIKTGIRNVIRWIPVIWEDEDFDWAYLARVMEFKMRNMSNYLKNYGHHVNSDKDAKNLLICTNLLRRLIEDDPSGVSFQTHENRMNEYQETLGKMIGKHLMTWWD